MGNEKYRIKIEAPILRPGLSVETEVSQKYLVPTLNAFLDSIRQFNIEQKEKEGEG